MEARIEKFFPLASLVLSVIITAGGAYMSSRVQSALMEERLATMQRDMARHEMEKSEQIAHNRSRADDHEQRIIRLEANFSTIQETLGEVKSDVKSLIKIALKGASE